MYTELLKSWSTLGQLLANSPSHGKLQRVFLAIVLWQRPKRACSQQNSAGPPRKKVTDRTSLRSPYRPCLFRAILRFPYHPMVIGPVLRFLYRPHFRLFSTPPPPPIATKVLAPPPPLTMPACVQMGASVGLPAAVPLLIRV